MATIKSIITHKILLMPFILACLLIPLFVQAANVDCCIVTTDTDLKFTDISSCKKNITLEQCHANTIGNKQAMPVTDCNTQCASKNTASTTFEGTWCCVEKQPLILTDEYEKKEESNQLLCESIRNGGTCLSGTLNKNACYGVPGCKQYAQKHPGSSIYKTIASEQAKKAQENVIKQQVKPKLNTPLPGIVNPNDPFEDIKALPVSSQGKQYVTIPWIAQYIQWIYNYAIGIAGIIATVMVMIGGIFWITSGGDTGRVAEAKNYIKSALLGLILIMSAYLIANYINPRIVNPSHIIIEVPNPDANQSEFAKCQIDTTSDKNIKLIEGRYYCSEVNKFPNLLELYSGKESAGVKTKPQHIVPTSSTWGTYIHPNALTALQKAATALQTIDNGQYKGAYIYIANTTRSLNSQQRLCNCWEAYKATNFTVCNCNHCNKAAPAKCYANGHGSGRAMDITIRGGGLNCGRTVMEFNCSSQITNKTAIEIRDRHGYCKSDPKYQKCQDVLYKVMTSAGFKGISNEWWHFYLP